MIIVEKIDGDSAVLEDNSREIYIKLTELPNGISEGDVLVFDEEKRCYFIDDKMTSSRRAEILKLQDSLWE